MAQGKRQRHILSWNQFDVFQEWIPLVIQYHYEKSSEMLAVCKMYWSVSRSHPKNRGEEQGAPPSHLSAPRSPATMHGEEERGAPPPRKANQGCNVWILYSVSCSTTYSPITWDLILGQLPCTLFWHKCHHVYAQVRRNLPSKKMSN